MENNGKDFGFFFNSEDNDRLYDADSFSDWLKKFFTTGVFEGDLMVSANDNMTVTVSTGYANTEGKVRLFDAATTLVIETADATYNRIDTIVVERNDTNREITLKVVKGGLASEPTPVAPVRENGIYQLVLAEVYVAAGATSITQSVITDKRTDTTVCGLVITPVDTFDFDQFKVQFDAYLAEFKATRAASFVSWELMQEAAFEAWFQEMKDQLSEDAAGHLQNEIDELKAEGLSGSIITITTTETALIGKTVTLTSEDGQTKTGVFGSDKKATIKVVDFVGQVHISSTDSIDTAEATVTIPYFGNYEFEINFWTAIVGISTPSGEFYGQTITVTDSQSQTVGTLTFSNLGTATFYAKAPDTYKFSVTYGGETFEESLVVTEETTYTVELSYYTIYGFHLDGNESVPSEMLSYEVQHNGRNVDNYDFTPAHVDFTTNKIVPGSWNLTDDFFIPRSCMLKYDGTVDYYLDEDDESKKEDGTASDVANTAYGGNAMMEWGRDGKQIWIKCVPDSGDAFSATFYVADRQLDSDFHAWSFYDQNGVLIPHCYTAKYNGVNISSKLRSISGQSILNNVAGATEVTYATANNVNGATEWYTEVFADRMMINVLLMLIGRNMNTQAQFGNGHYTGGSAAGNLLRTGTMNGKGQFYGTNGTGAGVKVFGMENYWGNQWRRIAGWLNVNGTQKIKWTWSRVDGSTQVGYDSTGSGYITISSATPAGTSGGYQNKTKFGADGSMIPTNAAGSETTYYCDGLWFNNGQSNYALVGGRCDDGFLVGAFCVGLGSPFSVAAWSVGAALSCKPLAA